MAERYASKAIATAYGELGYTEKANGNNLYSKTANAGSKNYTKYAHEFDTKYPTFYNTKKQGAAWCDIWYDWVLVVTFGEDECQQMTGQPDRSCGAGCSWSVKYYKSIGRWFKTPKPGDQIFFYNSSCTDIAHTGMVVKVDGTYVYTIEGNTSSASGVVANGGCVAEKKYKLNYYRIAGYGRPWYDEEPVQETKPATSTKPATKPAAKPATSTTKFSKDVQDWQKAAIADKYTFPKYGADGDWGSECEAVAKKAICRKAKVFGIYSNKNLTKFVQKKCGLTGSDVDGKFWKGTETAVKAYQRKHGLEVDGVVGYNTWRKMCGIK